MTGLRAPLALVVGGTGMLAGVVRGLVHAGHRTAVVARDPARTRRIAATTGDADRVIAVAADYGVPGALSTALDAALGPYARIATAVLWVHSPHRHAVHEAVAARLSDDAVVVDVLGSGTADPSPAAAPRQASVLEHGARAYRAVVLGFADGPAGSTRWLTHEEISDGVLGAVTGTAGTAEADDGRTAVRTVVGRVRPWLDRPG